MPASAISPTVASASRPMTSRARSDMRSGPRGPQRVAHAAGGVDERRAVLVELLAQVADVGLQDAGVAAEVVVPHLVEDLRAREHAARVEHQVAQQAVLGGGELDELAG